MQGKQQGRVEGSRRETGRAERSLTARQSQKCKTGLRQADPRDLGVVFPRLSLGKAS